MLGLSAGELLTIGIIAFLVFGAKSLPELGKGLGEGMRGFRDGLRGHDGTGTPSAQPPEQHPSEVPPTPHK